MAKAERRKAAGERGLEVPASWGPARARAAAGGRLLVIGGIDTGKTTLCAVLARAAFEAGRRTAVVDGDIGQSDIGPPATVAFSLVKQEFARLQELETEGLFFVGSCSPERHLLQMAVGVARMAEEARARGAETVVVDTTGLVAGGVGRALKAAKIRLLEADCVIALQREGELEPLLAPYRLRVRPEVIRLSPSRLAAARSREERAAYRRQRFAEYFAGAEAVRFAFGEVAFEGSLLGSGRELAGHLSVFAGDTLETELVHGEVTAEEALLVVAGRFERRGLPELEAALGRRVRVAEASGFENLLVGLLGEAGEALAVGSVTGMDFGRKELEVIAPRVERGKVKAVAFGSLRVAPDGRELGGVEPGELG